MPKKVKFQISFENKCITKIKNEYNEDVLVLVGLKRLESNLLKSFAIQKPFFGYRNKELESSFRKAITLCLITFEFVCALRWVALAIATDINTWRYLGDFFYIFPGHRLMMATGFGLLMLSLLARLVMFWCDLNGRLAFLGVFGEMITGFQKARDIGFTTLETAKFAKKVYVFNRMTHYGRNIVMATMFSSIIACAVLTALIDPKITFWQLSLGLVIIFGQIVSITNFGFAVSAIPIIVPEYIVMNFRHNWAFVEKTSKNKRMPSKVLESFMKNFDSICVFVADYNKLANYFIGIFVFWCTPLFCVYFYVSIFAFDILLLKIAAMFIFLNLVAMIAAENHQAAKIAKEAHKPYLVLNALMSKSRNLSIRLRLKLMTAIERLAGPTIGVYCYQLFAFTPAQNFNVSAKLTKT